MADLKQKYKTIYEYLQIFLGVTLMAVASNVFFEPNGMVTGGVSGLGIIIQNVSRNQSSISIPLWLTNTVFNIPLFIIGARVLGFKTLRRTLFATAGFSLALFLTAFIPEFNETDYLLIAVFGGVLSGTGLGLVFRCMATTGGSDLGASIINKFYKHISVSRIMFVIDAIVICVGFFIFGPVKALYGIIAVFVASKLSGTLVDGLSFAKAAFIISDESETIADRLMADLQRGVTGLHGKGMFTQKETNVILCVVSTKEIVKLKELVHDIDKRAFVIVADVREALGEGFQSI